MTHDDLRTIEEVAETYRNLMKAGCTGFDYPMPCPTGVNIHQCFTLYNDCYKRISCLVTRQTYGTQLSGATEGIPAHAAFCTRCGECKEAFPQLIIIPKELTRVSTTPGGSQTKMMFPLLRLMFRTIVKESLRDSLEEP